MRKAIVVIVALFALAAIAHAAKPPICMTWTGATCAPKPPTPHFARPSPSPLPSTVPLPRPSTIPWYWPF